MTDDGQQLQAGRHAGGGDGRDAVAQRVLDMSVVITFSYRKGLGSDGVWADCLLHQTDCIPKAVSSALSPHDAPQWALQPSLYTVAFSSTSETPIQLKFILYTGITDVFPLRSQLQSQFLGKWVWYYSYVIQHFCVKCAEVIWWWGWVCWLIFMESSFFVCVKKKHFTFYCSSPLIDYNMVRVYKSK